MPAKNKIAISTATVHFVSYQTVRVRTENGEILKAKLKGLQDVLPGDQVEILSRFQGYRGRAAKVVEIISVQGLSEYQVVVQARHSGKFRSGKSKLAVSRTSSARKRRLFRIKAKNSKWAVRTHFNR